MKYVASTILVATACLMALLSIPQYGWMLVAACMFHILDERDA